MILTNTYIVKEYYDVEYGVNTWDVYSSTTSEYLGQVIGYDMPYVDDDEDYVDADKLDDIISSNLKF